MQANWTAEKSVASSTRTCIRYLSSIGLSQLLRRWAELVGEFVTKGKLLFVEGRLQLRSYQDREGKKRDVTEVVVYTLRFLGPPKNGNGAKPAESSKAAEPSDEGDNPFNEPADGSAESEIPF